MKTGLEQLESWLEKYYKTNGAPAIEEIRWQISVIKENEYKRSEKRYNLSESLLDDIIKELEEVSHGTDNEIGKCRSLEDLIIDGAMPDVYYKLIYLRDKT